MSNKTLNEALVEIRPTKFYRVYVGFDLGLNSTGVGIIADDKEMAYSVNCPPKLSEIERLDWWGNQFREFFPRMAFSYLKVGIEGYAYGIRRGSVMFQQGEQGGLIKLILHNKSIPYKIFTPNEIKKFATGKGNCSKDLVLMKVYKKWGKEFQTSHAADAFTIAKMLQACDGNVQLLEYEKEVLKKHLKNETA